MGLLLKCYNVNWIDFVFYVVHFYSSETSESALYTVDLPLYLFWVLCKTSLHHIWLLSLMNKKLGLCIRVSSCIRANGCRTSSMHGTRFYSIIMSIDGNCDDLCVKSVFWATGLGSLSSKGTLHTDPHGTDICHMRLYGSNWYSSCGQAAMHRLCISRISFSAIYTKAFVTLIIACAHSLRLR